VSGRLYVSYVCKPICAMRSACLICPVLFAFSRLDRDESVATGLDYKAVSRVCHAINKKFVAPGEFANLRSIECQCRLFRTVGGYCFLCVR